MKENPPLPPGMQKFQDEIKSRVKNPFTDHATIDCDICCTEIPLNKMNVFVYPDAPYHTTKALCYICLKNECLKHDITLKN